jgi:hypothetical protein
MQGISFFKFLLMKKKHGLNDFMMLHHLLLQKTSCEIKTIQNAKQIVSIHSDSELNGNKEKLGYEK